jgi:DNA-binding NarL/FixJ family response regulator
LTLAIEAVLDGNVYLDPHAAQVVVKDVMGRTGHSRETAFGVLTVREREVLQLLAEGMTNKQVGKRLHISAKTVETHRAQVMVKLDLHTVAELTKYAVRQGLTPLES